MPVEVATGDIPAAGEADKLLADKPDVIFHLAAIVSGEAEQDFDKGYRINMDGTRAPAGGGAQRGPATSRASCLPARSPCSARLSRMPSATNSSTRRSPPTARRRAICELLISDYSRKGFVDGISLRLPTICVRPGKPNKAASGFFSNIMREPLAGQEAVLPVSDSVMHWHASPAPRSASCMHAATLDTAQDRARAAASPCRASRSPSASRSRRSGRSRATRWWRASAASPIPFIEKIVAGWPRKFAAKRALELGFKADDSFEEIIRIHIEDELGGKIA